MMKICHISTVHPYGDVRIFHKECVSLANHGYDVTLIIQGENKINSGVKILGLRKPRGLLDRMVFLAREAYSKAMAENADIYHIHDPELLPMALKLERRGKRVVFDSHEIYSIQISEKPYLPDWSKSWIRRLYSLYETRVAKRIDAIIVPCTVNGKNIFEGRCKRTVFIANYPSLEEFLTCEDGSIPDCRKDAICFLGKPSEGHGFTHLMRAAYNAGFKLVVAGRPENQYWESVKAMREFLCVDYRGYVDRSGVKQILKECSVGAATYLLKGQYALPLDNVVTKAYEYMCAGIPVLYTRRAYTIDFFEEKYKCGICVAPTDEDELVNALLDIKSNPQKADHMGENGWNAIRSELNWENEYLKLEQLYIDITRRLM